MACELADIVRSNALDGDIVLGFSQAVGNVRKLMDIDKLC